MNEANVCQNLFSLVIEPSFSIIAFVPAQTPRTVSYTHLDVYKRQPKTLYNFYRTLCIKNFKGGAPVMNKVKITVLKTTLDKELSLIHI